MKKWKRLFSLVCAFAMIFSLNTTAFAAELPKTDTKQQYEITVGDEAITLEEGEVVEIPMTLIENDESAHKTFFKQSNHCRQCWNIKSLGKRSLLKLEHCYDCSCDTLHWNSKQHRYNLWS